MTEDQIEKPSEQPAEKPIMPLAFSSSGAMAGVSPRYSIPDELAVQAAAIENSMRQIAQVAAGEMQEAGEALRTSVTQASRLFEAAMAGLAESAAAFNGTLLRAAQEHINEGMVLIQDLTAARDPAEAFAIQARYVQRQVMLLSDQVEDFHAAAERLLESASAPVQAEMMRSAQRFRSC